MDAEIKKRFKDPLVIIYIIMGILPFFTAFIPATDSVSLLQWFYLLSAAGCTYWFIKMGRSYKNLVPIFLMLSMSYVYFNFASDGYTYWQYPFAFGLMASALWIAGMDVEVAFIIAIVFAGATIHMIPALLTDMLEEIDPYYHYKWAELVFNTGKMPIHDWLTYPKIGGLDRSTMPLANSLSIAFFGYIGQFFGHTLYDSAMLMPVISSVLTLLVSYVVLKEAYWKHPSAKYAAMLGVFVLMLSIGWSTKAHATDSEDDVTGGLAFMAAMMFLLMAVNRDDVKLSIVGGFVFGWLITMYDGQRLLMMVAFLAIALMSVIGIFQKKNSFIYLKHFGIMWVIGQILSRFILHYGEGIGFGLFVPTSLEFAALALAVAAVAANELYMRKILDGNKIAILAVICVVIAGGFVWNQFYKAAFIDARQSSVVFKTIAEQAPFASDISTYVKALINIFGVFSLISLVCVPGLLYLGYKEYKFSYILFAVWMIVLGWGLYFKSQYMFASSLPFCLVGSFAALFMIREKKDLEGLAIIPTMVVLFTAMLYTPMASIAFTYNPTAIFFQVASYDRIGWEPALQFFKNELSNTAVVTWWDYGHWLTTVSHKFVLIDNLQRDHHEIQEVAQFFMKETDEEKAMDILRSYQDVYKGGKYKELFGGVNLRYAAIDWTMIGKSGAMRFIATGNLTDQSDGEYDSYITCGFLPEYSDVKGKVISQSDGSFIMTKSLIYGCQQNRDGLGGILFEVRDKDMNVYAIDQDGLRVDWNSWIITHDSSLFGVKSPGDILGVCMQYSTDISRVSPTYTNFIYGGGKFKNFMLARMYFGEYIESYKSLGLADVTWGKMKYFKKVQSFENGFVDVWEINYDGWDSGNVIGNSTVFTY